MHPEAELGSALHLGHRIVLGIPFLGCFTWPLAVAKLWLRYFVTNILFRFGYPLRKPFLNAFMSGDSLGLPNDWCTKFTALAWVLMEWANAAQSMSCGFL